MYFIGIIGDEDYSYKLEKELQTNKSEINMIIINDEIIENIRNIKFSILVINKDLNAYIQNKAMFEFILNNSKYILINSDIKRDFFSIKNEKLNIITFGLNAKSTITISSRTEEEILISVQREINNIKGEIIEVQEIKRKLIKENKTDVYFNLIVSTIEKILDFS